MPVYFRDEQEDALDDQDARRTRRPLSGTSAPGGGWQLDTPPGVRERSGPGRPGLRVSVLFRHGDIAVAAFGLRAIGLRLRAIGILAW